MLFDAQVRRLSISGRSDFPFSVNAYSTRGGTSGKASRLINSIFYYKDRNRAIDYESFIVKQCKTSIPLTFSTHITYLAVTIQPSRTYLYNLLISNTFAQEITNISNNKLKEQDDENN